MFMLLLNLFMVCLIAVNEAFRISWKLWHRIIKSIELLLTTTKCYVSLLSAVSLVVSSLPSLIMTMYISEIMTMKTSKELSSEMLSVFLLHCLVVINTRLRSEWSARISCQVIGKNASKTMRGLWKESETINNLTDWLLTIVQAEEAAGWQCGDLIYIRALIKSP